MPPSTSTSPVAGSRADPVDPQQEVGAVGLGAVAVVGEHVEGAVAVRHHPLKPWTGWSAKGAAMPFTGAVPSAAPAGSLPGTNVRAGREAKPVRVGVPADWAEEGAATRPSASTSRPTPAVRETFRRMRPDSRQPG